MALIKLNTRSLATDNNLGRRNLLINGDMLISQRAGSFTGGTSQFYTLDRWIAAVGSAFNLDVAVTQSNTVPTGQGFKHSLKVEANTVQTPSSSQNGGIAQRLEGQNLYRLNWGTSDAKDVTLSFWVRSNKTGTYCVQLQQNVGGSASDVYSHVKEYTIDTADTWEKKTITFPGNTVQAQTQSTGDGLRVNWWLSGGSDDYTTADTWEQIGSYLITSNQVNFMDNAANEWYLTGCQLESGSSATDFEHLMEAETLALCQRYYQAYGRDASAPFRIIGSGNGSSDMLTGFIYPMEMRTTPTLNYFGGNTDGGNFNNYVNGSATTNTGPNSTDAGKYAVRWNFPGNGSYPNSAYWIDVGTGSNQFGWTMDAEL